MIGQSLTSASGGWRLVRARMIESELDDLAAHNKRLRWMKHYSPITIDPTQ